MNGLLASPTAELVRAKCHEFDTDYSTRLAEDALGELWKQFPGNTEMPHVLLKVLALNKLYNTRVRDIDVEILSSHIVGRDIDPLLAEGSPKAVGLISHCETLRNYFSFATKYCSWHNPEAYPIYDTRVDNCLWFYKKQDGHQENYPTFQRKDLGDYVRFREIVADFRNFYKLDSFTFKAIDKFLWLQGESLLPKINSPSQ